MIAEVSSIDPSVNSSTSNSTATVTVTTAQVSVTWLDDGSANGLWIISPNEVSINKKIELIVYTLTEKSTPGVQFLPSTPALWISPPLPDNFDTKVSEDGRQVFIADSNQTTGDPQSFSFRLLTVYDNATRISPDPTIINREPS